MIKYPIKTREGDISQLRTKRLLLLATEPRDHKSWYHEYYFLVWEGLIQWTMGTAFLTDLGERELERLENLDIE